MSGFSFERTITRESRGSVCVLFTCYIIHALKICIYVCYVRIYLFHNTFTARATTHDVAARNGANSKHNPNNDEDDVRNRHPTTLLFSSTFSHVFIFHKMDSIVSAFCKTSALFALFALLTSATFTSTKPF